MDETLVDVDIQHESMDKGLLNPFDIHCLKGASYDIRVGKEAIVATSKEYKKINLLEEKDKTLRIRPGRTVVVYSHERISMPNNIKGRLSLRSFYATKGLNFVGGVIDPGYKGYLFFSVTNLSNADIDIAYGERLVSAEFVRMGEDVKHAYADGKIFVDVPHEKLPPLPLDSVYDLVDASARINELNKNIKECMKRDVTLTSSDYMELGESLIRPFNQERVKGASYDLSVGNKIILSLPKSTLNKTVQPTRQWIELSEANPSYEIPPQHSVTIYSHERVFVPVNMLGHLNIRSHFMAHRLNFDGGLVDPGYKGKLFFTMTNIGDSSVRVSLGEPIVSIEFVRLPSEALSYSLPDSLPIEDIQQDKLPPPPEGDYFGLIKLTSELKSVVSRLDTYYNKLTESEKQYDVKLQEKTREIHQIAVGTRDEMRPIQRITELFFMALLAGFVLLVGSFLLDKIKDPLVSFNTPGSGLPIVLGVFFSTILVAFIFAWLIFRKKDRKDV